MEKAVYHLPEEDSRFLCNCVNSGECGFPCVQCNIAPFANPVNQITFTFQNGGGYENAVGFAVLTPDGTEFTATIDGIPAMVVPFTPEPNIGYVALGTFTQSSIVVITFTAPVSQLLFACLVNSDALTPG